MKSLSRFLARTLPALTLVAWSVMIFYFHFSGRLKAYVTEDFRTLALIAAVLLPVVALGLLFTAKGVIVMPDDECDPATFGNAGMRAEPKLRPGQLLAFLILTLPIGAAAAVTADGFSASTVRNRGVVQGTAAIPQSARTFQPAPPTPPAQRTSPAPLEPALPTADGSVPAEPAAPAGGPRVDSTSYLRKSSDGTLVAEVVDFLFAADQANDRGDFEGKKFEVIGQFLPDQGGNKLKFQLVRMFMFCCAADSRPIAITVEAPGALDGLAEMGWVKVVGTINFLGNEQGRFSPVLRADRIAKTEPPPEVMLY